MNCALKVISKEKLRENQVYEKLMKQELDVLSKVSHSNIMRVYELLQDTQNIYVVTEFLSGGELEKRLIQISNF
jgi:serine/threonine protein kinase